MTMGRTSWVCCWLASGPIVGCAPSIATPGDDVASSGSSDAEDTSPASSAPSTSLGPDTGNASEECQVDGQVPACEQTECVQRWDYQCTECESLAETDCFSYVHGCANPSLECAGGAEPCDAVFAHGLGTSTLTALADDAAAICVLTSLQAGVPGTYEIQWGEMDDRGWLVEKVHASGNGTVVVEWIYDNCSDCLNFGRIGRSGALVLQPAAYFDECLAMPTTESLIACTIGLLDIDIGNPPQGYTPPFTTGECASLEAACP